MDAVDLVVDTNERQLASRFRDAGEIDTQPQARMTFSPGRSEQEVPLGVSEEGPARGGTPVVFIEEVTDSEAAPRI